MKRLFFLSILLSAFSAYAADENKYDVSRISPELLKNVSAVKRFELIRFEIKDPGTAYYYYKKVVTIFDENGDKHASWSESYDKNISIRSVDAVLYDARGKKIKSLRNSEISDVTGTSEGTLADDHRYKFHNFHYKIYPYTVEYEVELKYNQLMFMPSWMPVEDDSYSVESSVFEVIAPADYLVRYKSFLYNKEPVITAAKAKTYHWEVNNFAAVADEYAAPEWQKITPTVIVGATEFEIAGHKGNMSDWNQFGKFLYSLKQNRDNLPSTIKTAVHDLTDKVTDVKKKIVLLYNYLQQNTRYISIQLGIGGWQPFDAEYVAAKKYGDCKALTNFMYSLLKEAGIKSVYTLVKAGEHRRYIHEDFAAQQFNHVILSVPMAKDTMWLECTSQTLPAGYISSFTSDRYALMVTEDGGRLVRTPSYKLKDNLQLRRIKASIDETGKLSADVSTDYKAMQQDELFNFINSHSKKEQLEYLKKEINLPNYDVSSFEYKTSAEKIPVVNEKMMLNAEHYAQVTGKRIFIQPNILSKSNTQLKDIERHHDIDLLFEYTDIDTIEIAIPAGYIIESLPQAQNVNNKFGQFKTDYKLQDNKILMTRYYERRSGKYPKADYPDFVKFYNEMYRLDRAKVVLIKKEG